MEDPLAGYAHEHRPLAGYAVLNAAFGAALGGALAAAHATGRLPERPHPADVVLAGVATHKVARLLARDRVTSFVRAPFVSLEGRKGHGELDEEPRGRGVRLAMGELLVCPYCLAQWVAAAFFVGGVFAPRATRLLAGMWTAETIADFLQLAYSAGEAQAS